MAVETRFPLTKSDLSTCSKAGLKLSNIKQENKQERGTSILYLPQGQPHESDHKYS